MSDVVLLLDKVITTARRLRGLAARHSGQPPFSAAVERVLEQLDWIAELQALNARFGPRMAASLRERRRNARGETPV
jgi:hypothetical protein